MGFYEQTSKKTANKSKNAKLFPDKDDIFTLGFLEQRWLEMDGARDDSKWELRMEQEDANITWNADGTANINLPIERSQNRLKEADESAQKPQITFIPNEPDDIYKVEITEELFDYAWKEANTDEELAKMRQCKRIIGTSVWKEYIKTDRLTKWVLNQPDKDGKITGEHKTITRSWIQGKMIDIRNIWFDPVHNQDDIVDCFELEVDISRSELEALKGDPNYKNIEEALKLQSINDELRGKAFFVNEENRQNTQIEDPKFAIFGYYNRVKGIYIQTINFQTIIREGVNPCPTGKIPFVILVDEPKYMSLYGRGMNEQLESAKYELNVITNQLVDLVRESSTNTLLLGGDASIDDNQIVNGIGRILSIDGESFQWSTPPQSDKGLGNLRSIMQQDATMITGIDAYSVQGDTARTLGQEEIREVNRLKSLATSAMAYDFFLVRMARLKLAYIQFYLPATTGKKIIGEGKVRSIPIRGKKIKKTKGVNAEGEIIEKGISFEASEGFTDFLEVDQDMIMSNLDVEVETPLTSTALKQIKKLRHNEVFNSATQAATLNPEIAQKLGKFVEESLKVQLEDIGVNPSKLFEVDEGKARTDKRDKRAAILDDMPMPPKPSEQPARSNRDQLANVAGLNLPGQTAEEVA